MKLSSFFTQRRNGENVTFYVIIETAFDQPKINVGAGVGQVRGVRHVRGVGQVTENVR